MTTDVADQPQPAPAPGPARLRKTLADMARSLVPLLLVIGVLAWLHSPSGERLPTVDPSGQFAAARAGAAFPVLEPRGLPAGWRATSARTTLPDVKGQGPVTLDVGYRTASDHFARLVQTDVAGAEDRYLGADRRERGTVDVGGRQWRRSDVGRRDEALVSVENGRTTMVTGDAPLDELRVLAAALR